MIEKLALLFALLIGLMTGVATVQAQEWSIVAVVNDDIISGIDLQNRIDLGLVVSHILDTPENRKRLTMQALATLIDETIREQEAKRLDITVAQEEINQAFTQIAAQNNVPPEIFVREFAKNKSAFDSMKKQIHAQIAWNGVVKRVLRPKVNISENDIDIAIADNNRDAGKTEYLVSEIFLGNTVQDADKNADLADKLYQELQKGAPFPALARQFSNGIGAGNGGELGWLSEEQIDSELRDFIIGMPEGAVSKPIKTSLGYHILGLQKKRTIQPLVGQEKPLVHIKQIFFPLNAASSNKVRLDTFNAIKTLQSDVKTCDDMDTAIAENTNDITGDLGWVDADAIDADRRAFLDKLGTEQLSRPLKLGEDGFLVMMVCGTKTSAPEQDMRESIANRIGNERLERMQERYMQDLKATALIDVKL